MIFEYTEKQRKELSAVFKEIKKASEEFVELYKDGRTPSQEQHEVYSLIQERHNTELRGLLEKFEAEKFSKLEKDEIVQDAKNIAEHALYYVVWDYNNLPNIHDWIKATGTGTDGKQYFKDNDDKYIYDENGKKYFKVDPKSNKYEHRVTEITPEGRIILHEPTPAPKIKWRKTKYTDLQRIDTPFMTYLSNLEMMNQSIDRLKNGEKLFEDPIKFTREGMLNYLKNVALKEHYTVLANDPDQLKEIDSYLDNLLKDNPYILTKYITRTIAEAEKNISEVPGKYAVITQKPYANSLSFNDDPAKTAFLQKWKEEAVDGLTFYNGELYFENLIEFGQYTAQLQNMVTKEGITEIDLLTLRLFYSVYVQNNEEQIKRGEDPGEIFTIYIPDMLKKIGKGHHQKDIDWLIEKTKSYHITTGVVRKERNGRIYPAHYQVLNFESFDPATNTLTVSSPYMHYLVKDIFKLSIRKDKKGKPITAKDGNYLTDASHSYLIHADIAQEKNKAAVENVFIITTMIEQAGDNEPHIKASTLIERNMYLNDWQYHTNPGQLLKRTFKKTWQLLREKTDLQAAYKNIQLPDPVKDNPAYLPTPGNMNTLVLRFPHEGKVQK